MFCGNTYSFLKSQKSLKILYFQYSPPQTALYTNKHQLLHKVKGLIFKDPRQKTNCVQISNQFLMHYLHLLLFSGQVVSKSSSFQPHGLHHVPHHLL